MNTEKNLPGEIPFAARFAEPVEDVRVPADQKVSDLYGDPTTVNVSNGQPEWVSDDT